MNMIENENLEDKNKAILNLIDDCDDVFEKFNACTTTQLHLLSPRLEGDEKECVDLILKGREEKSKQLNSEELKTMITEQEKTKDVKPTEKFDVKKMRVKKNCSTAKVFSDNLDVQAKIDALPTLVGEELSDALHYIENNSIDIQFLKFINVGDTIEFMGSHNSKHYHKRLSGKVVLDKIRDKYGKYYCRIKDDTTGELVSKQQAKVVRISVATK